MNKVNLSTGQPVFSQVLKLIPKDLLSDLIEKHQVNRYCKRFKGTDHVVSMLYASFYRCTSLQEVITGLQANGSRLLHLGLTQTPRRSTLADANIRTSEAFFGDLFHELQKHYYKSIPDSRRNTKADDGKDLFIIDSTTVTLFSDVMKGAGSYDLSGKKKGGVKAHTVVDSKHDIPCYVDLTEARAADKSFLKKVDNLPPGSTVTLDKGYNSYEKYREWTEKDIRWVTRINDAAIYNELEAKKFTTEDREEGVRKDLVIDLGNPVTAYKTPIQRARLILFYDKVKQRYFEFITNDFESSPATIARIYKKRWQIETLFKRIKSNFSLKYFLGETPNAIKIQIWSTLLADLLIKIIQDKIQSINNKKWAYANLAGLIRHHLSTYIDLLGFLLDPNKALFNYKPPEDSPQFNLFS